MAVNVPGISKPKTRAQRFVETCIPLMFPNRKPTEAEKARDIQIVTSRQLMKEPLDDILLAVREARKQAEYGKLPGFIEPGQPFTLRALLYQGQGPTNYTGFLCEARKRQEKKTSHHVAAIFSAIANGQDTP